MLVIFKKGSPFVGGGASPFIDKGDGFTSECEGTYATEPCCPRLPSLVAHASGYKIVGAYNTVDITVEWQMHTGGRAAFFRDGRRRYLQILFDA